MSESEKNKDELERLNKALARMGVPIEITEKIEWEPGDEVKNIGHAILAEEHSMSVHGIEGKDGCMIDPRYAAPELFKEDEKLNEEEIMKAFESMNKKLGEAFDSLTGIAGVMEQFTQVLNRHNDVGNDLSERIDNVQETIS